MTSEERPSWYVGAAIGCAGVFLLTALWLTRKGVPLPPDTMEYAEVARNLVRGDGYAVNFVEIHPGLLPGIHHLHELHGLLQPLFLAPLFWIFGPAGELVRIPGLLFLSLTAITTFELGRSYMGGWCGLVAGGLILTRRDLSFDAALGGDDIGWTLFSALSLFFFLRGRETGRDRCFAVAGVFAALALLEKFSGFMFALAALVTWATTRRSGVGIAWRRCSMFLLPVIAAAMVYFARNWALHGGFGFRFGALDWIARANPSLYFAYYSAAPKLGDVWASMGIGGFLVSVADQLRLLGVLICSDPFLVFGLVALLAMTRKNGQLALFGAVHFAGIALLITCLYHVEGRYIFAVYPLHAVAIAGVVTDLVRLVSRLAPERRRLLVGLVSGPVAGLLIWGIALVMGMHRAIGAASQRPIACADALQFVRNNIPEDAPILTSNPWFLTWFLDRPSVNVPTNGEQALSTVALHYGAHWAIGGFPSFGTANVDDAMRALRRSPTGLQPRVVFRGAECNVYRIDRR